MTDRPERCPLCGWEPVGSFSGHADDCLPIRCWPAVAALKAENEFMRNNLATAQGREGELEARVAELEAIAKEALDAVVESDEIHREGGDTIMRAIAQSNDNIRQIEALQERVRELEAVADLDKLHEYRTPLSPKE